VDNRGRKPSIWQEIPVFRYIGIVLSEAPYMGVRKEGFFEQKGDFSPKKSIYPQFSTTYPHIKIAGATQEKD
jgi:hypothetical protein